MECKTKCVVHTHVYTAHFARLYTLHGKLCIGGASEVSTTGIQVCIYMYVSFTHVCRKFVRDPCMPWNTMFIPVHCCGSHVWLSTQVIPWTALARILHSTEQQGQMESGPTCCLPWWLLMSHIGEFAWYKQIQPVETHWHDCEACKPTSAPILWILTTRFLEQVRDQFLLE